jgi:hypothetical protein
MRPWESVPAPKAGRSLADPVGCGWPYVRQAIAGSPMPHLLRAGLPSSRISGIARIEVSVQR